MIDLRQCNWEAWVGLLQDQDRMLFRCSVQYDAGSDTLALLYPHAMQSRIGQDGFARVAETIRGLYDANRMAWVSSLSDLGSAGSPPTAAVMPNIEIQIAPPWRQNH